MSNMTKEWLSAAYDDLLTVEEIKNNSHLTHIVAFHAQQCVEKSFKAILENQNVEFPNIHKLIRLYKLIPIPVAISNFDFLTTLDKLYIDSRYPTDFGLLPYGKPTLKDAQEFYEFAQEIFNEVCTILKIDPQEVKK
jgi:HEPN domain-containing protein